MNFKIYLTKLGYLGPIDIPLWQNINCLRNLQFQYDLPQKIFYTPPSFPGLVRSEGRSLADEPKKVIKPDSSRKVAYELAESILDK